MAIEPGGIEHIPDSERHGTPPAPRWWAWGCCCPRARAGRAALGPDAGVVVALGRIPGFLAAVGGYVEAWD